MRDFKDKVVLITGGSSGIGLALARALAGFGARLWLLARDEQRLSAAVTALRTLQPSRAADFHALSTDVSDAHQVAQAIAYIHAQDGVPDVVINSAGVTHPGYVQDLDLDLFRWMMEVNYLGTVYVTKAVLPGMIARRSGHIVNISSLAGVISIFGYSAYAPSKAAVRSFSEVLRCEMKPYGIGVSIVYPSDTDTPQLAYENRFKPPETKALGALASALTADQVAQAILKGIIRRRFIIVPGLESKFWYLASWLAGPATYPILDWLIARARRQLQASAKA
jgi:3-dehydrosphinganine reductase